MCADGLQPGSTSRSNVLSGFLQTDRNRFASWTGTAPLDASSGENNRHRLSRAGNRRMNHMIHIAAVTQIRLDTEGRTYYRRKRADGKDSLEAIRCLKRRISDVVYRQLIADAQGVVGRVREGTAGRLFNPARPTGPAHRHFGSATSRTHKTDATTGRYVTEDPAKAGPQIGLLTTDGAERTQRGHSL